MFHILLLQCKTNACTKKKKKHAMVLDELSYLVSDSGMLKQSIEYGSYVFCSIIVDLVLVIG